MKYKLGILGGMGPLATAKLFERIVKFTDAKCDQEHLEMVILNKSSIPDRTKAIFDNGLDPVFKINEGIDELINNNCEYFIIPCNTAHYFKERFNLQNKIIFIDMIDETLEYIKNNYPNKKICLLGTTGTVKSNVYHADNISYPNEAFQGKIMDIIYKTKAGFNMLPLLQSIIDDKSYDIYLLACTELSIYSDSLKGSFLDAMDILVCATLKKCNVKINKEYNLYEIK